MSEDEQVRLLREIRDSLLRHEESYRAITSRVLRVQKVAILAAGVLVVALVLLLLLWVIVRI